MDKTRQVNEQIELVEPARMTKQDEREARKIAAIRALLIAGFCQKGA